MYRASLRKPDKTKEKMETIIVLGLYRGLYRGNGKENGNYYII